MKKKLTLLIILILTAISLYGYYILNDPDFILEIFPRSSINFEPIKLSYDYEIGKISSQNYYVSKNDMIEVDLGVIAYKESNNMIFIKQVPNLDLIASGNFSDTDIQYWIITADELTGPINNDTFINEYKIDTNSFTKLENIK